MGKIKTVIVDDEPLARQTIRLLLKNDSEVELIGECGDGGAAVRLIRKRSPDLVFLDVQMPEMSGFDVLSELEGERLPVVVFVTAFDQYAIRAFEVNALDYLLKPFDDDRFEKALRRAKAQIKQHEIGDLSRRLMAVVENYQGAEGPEVDLRPRAEKSFLTRLMIKGAGRVFFLKVDEIDWIEAADYYVKLHVGRKSHLLRETMNDLEARLDPDQFIRIHRSTIVNIDRVREMQQHFGGDYLVVLHDGMELKLSRNRRERIQSALTRQL